MNTHPAILSQVIPLTAQAEDGPPVWVQMLPAAGKPFAAIDGRGPWQYDDAEALIRASMEAGPVIVDVNHSTLHRTARGEDAPALGRIVEMQARPDGLWGRVEWNAQGRAVMGSQPYAYSGISPVLLCPKSAPKSIARIAHVSLTNVPALGGSIASLTQETPTMNLAAIAKALGLSDGADEEAILAAIAKLKEGEKPVDLTALAGALGADAGASVIELTALARSIKAASADALQVAELTADLAALKADRFVDALTADGYAIDAEVRADLIALHAEDPARATRFAQRLPKLSGTHTRATPPEATEITALTADQRAVADLIGVSHDDMLATLKAEQKEAR